MASVKRQIFAGLVFGILCGLITAYAADAYSQRATVQKHDTYDSAGVEFFELRFTDGSALTISVDGKTKAAMALRGSDGKRVTFALTPEPERLTR